MALPPPGRGIAGPLQQSSMLQALAQAIRRARPESLVHLGRFAQRGGGRLAEAEVLEALQSVPGQASRLLRVVNDPANFRRFIASLNVGGPEGRTLTPEVGRVADILKLALLRLPGQVASRLPAGGFFLNPQPLIRKLMPFSQVRG